MRDIQHRAQQRPRPQHTALHRGPLIEPEDADRSVVKPIHNSGTSREIV